ncbi:MAG TPA: MFS transporter [Bryobacteraceae bacterium]|jgi:MFS family permease|nr:MFS transporter [Bryobacteraceae bacterium]
MTSETLKPRSIHWFALALLVISVCINYADRGNLGVAAKSISVELHLQPDQLGYLLAAFSLTYSISQMLSGNLLERWNINWAYAAAFLIWSAATGLTGLAHSFTTILLLRLLLGMSESIAYPAYSKIIVISFPEQVRGTANALIDAGSKLGPALGVLLGVKMVEWFTWRGMFVVIGAASLLWLLPWCLIARRLPSKLPAVSPVEAQSTSMREILSQRALWGTSLGLFGGNYTWFVFLNWLPYYFETQRHYTKGRLALFGSLPFWVIGVASLLFGILSDYLVRRGFDAGRVRQSFVCIGLLGCCALMLPAVAVANQTGANVLLLLASTSVGAWSSNHWALTQLLAGPKAAGKWTGIQNGIGNLAGVAGQIASGYALQTTHSFFAAFAIACVVLLVGVLGYWFIVGKPVVCRWSSDFDSTSSLAAADPAAQ